MTELSQMEELKSEIGRLKKEAESREWGLQKTNEAITFLYKDLARQRDELKKLDKLKSDFVSTVSHELRTPLAITREGISLIIDGLAGPINDQQKSLLTTAKDNIDRLCRIINDLLDMSKIEAGKVDLKLRFSDMTRMIDDLVKAYQTVAAPKKISISAKLPQETHIVHVDQDKIIQCLNNLLNNAIKFTPEGGRIEVELVHRENDILCRVKDTGRGIAETDMGRLFGKFQQFGRTEGGGIKGTGLGLSITKSLVEMHNGKIWAESRLGEGTIFNFTLPNYNEAVSIFEKRFDDILHDTQFHDKPTAFILVHLKNHDQIKNALGSNTVMEIMNEVLLACSEVITRPEDVIFLYCTHSIYVILPKTHRAGGYGVVHRFKQALSKSRFGPKNNPISVDIKFGMSIFPSESNNRVGLVKLAQEDVERSRTIMIIDDHLDIVKFLRTRLEELNFRITNVSQGDEAVRMIAKDKPDLIILDVMMSQINGYELLGRLKENPETKKIPVIILTTRHELIEEMARPENADSLSKDSVFNRLIHEIRAAL